ncbi:MAG: TonB-dependent receptor [Paraglaciecola sp.]|jgi:TonB-dependent receptor
MTIIFYKVLPSLNSCCTFLVARTLAMSILGASYLLASPAVFSEVQNTSQTNPEKDVTSQSPRERDRILLKRNPIASEYQSKDEPGEFAGAPSDAEGVDFRAQFRLPDGKALASGFKLDGNLNYQAFSKEVVPGGSLKIEKNIGSLSLQFQIQHNASQRIVDFYQARWLAKSEPNLSNDKLFLLGFPRYSRDYFDATSLDTRWRADYVLTDNIRFVYEGLATNYDDEFVRDRLEFQNGVGNLNQTTLGSDGSSIIEADISSSRLRRYFHRMETARDINRHRFSFIQESDRGSAEVGFYYSRWVNQRLWLPWNFVDSDVNTNYQVNDRYLPESTVSNSDLFNVSNSKFANYRPTDTTTTDTDFAFVFDWDHQLSLADQSVWVTAGIAWRTKERNNQNERAVYTPTTDTFTLESLVGENGPTSIIESQYTLPARLNTFLGDSYFQTNRESQFALNLSQSFLESIQDVYSSEETVSSAYINAYQQFDEWFWRVGLRHEKTNSNTRGAVSGPVASENTAQGQPITSIILEGLSVPESFDSFDAAFVEGDNSYDHWLPSLELRYRVNSDWSFKAAYLEQLMRPQYFDTVRYRRINPPTRTINEGTPDLKATSIQNLFAGFEYKYSQQGKLAAGAYYKSVSAFFYDTRVTELLDDVVFDVSRVENGEDGFIQGVQGYWSHGFSFSQLDSVDIQFSYTYSDSEADLVNRSIVMPERSKHLIALNLRLADKQWQYQSQFSWQSEALDNVGPSAAQDIYREDVLVWDQSFAWRFDKQWSARFSLNNVLDYPDRSYQGSETRVVNNQYSGYSVRMSLVFVY